MRKYFLYSDEGMELVKYFLFGDGNIDHLMTNQINNILRYSKTKQGDEKYLIVLSNDDVSAIAIIHKIYKTCYIYSNCGLSFDVRGFFNKIFKYKKYIVAISCDKLIYSRLKNYVNHKDILIEKTKIYYLLEYETLKSLSDSIISNDIAFDEKLTFSEGIMKYFIFNHFYKIIDKQRIIYVHDNFIGSVIVEDSTTFTKKYFKVIEESFKLEIDDEKVVEGSIVNALNDIKLKDFENDIISITQLSIQNQSCDIMFSLSKDHNTSLFNEILNIIIDFKFTDIQKIIYNDNKKIDRSLYSNLENTTISKRKYLYLYNKTNHVIEGIPEIRKKITTDLNILATIFFIISAITFMFFPMFFNFRILPEQLPEYNSIKYKLIFYPLWILIFLLPLGLFKPKRVYYDRKLIRNCYLYFDVSTIFYLILSIGYLTIFLF